ncbi:MAG: hypothetical protein K2K53_06030, partial [Oscillospiraceae bacterium]|nr:hypothetical protein [Oscillospiraceae bacterium]
HQRDEADGESLAGSQRPAWFQRNGYSYFLTVVSHPKHHTVNSYLLYADGELEGEMNRWLSSGI